MRWIIMFTPSVLLRYILSRQYNCLYIYNLHLINFTYLFPFNGKKPITFFMIHFIDILNLLLLNLWNFQIKSFGLLSRPKLNDQVKHNKLALFRNSIALSWLYNFLFLFNNLSSFTLYGCLLKVWKKKVSADALFLIILLS